MARLLLVAALFSLVLFFSLASGFSPFYRLLYALSAAVSLGLLWAWLNLRGLRVIVERPEREAHVHGWVEERVQVKNQLPLPRWSLEVADSVDLPKLQTGQVVSLPPGGSRSWSVRVRCSRRGLFTLGPAKVYARDPFGLFRLSRSFGSKQSILVYPAVIPLPQFTTPAADLAGESRVHRRVHQATASASSIRDYQPGDPFNRIHWPSTARFQKPMLKEFDLEPTSDFWVVLDLEQVVHAGHGEESTEEYGATIAASIAKRLLDAEMKVGLIAQGKHPAVFPAGVGEPQLARIMQSLALVKADGATPLLEVLASYENKLGASPTLVVITPSTSPGVVDGLRHLAHRGVKSVAVLLDAVSFGGTQAAGSVADALVVNDVAVHIVRRGDDIAQALAPSSRWQTREVLVS
ncbi:MAG: DUF58 domain-containing protein [Chloroflexi bacterium]|nr:DUF58 domain-containing protein [Chloroflexota bacterium]